jgi:hypothetical protein
MRGSAIYGLFLGVGIVLFLELAPQPLGSVVLWGFFAGQLTWAAALCWRRTGLPFVTAAMAIGAASSGMMAVLATAGHVLPDLLLAAWAPMVGVPFAIALLMVIESRIHREKWLQWERYMAQKSAWDILRGRHIPELRDRGV